MPWLPEKVRAMILGRLRALTGVVLILSGFACAALLWSYDPGDPSWNNAQSRAGLSVHNWLGSFGSTSADILRQFFGWASYLLCLMLFAWGWRMTGRHGLERFLGHTPKSLIVLLFGRALTALLALTAGSVALQSLFGSSMENHAGGALGLLLARKAAPFLPMQPWGQYALTALSAAATIGVAYMACALTFGEWSAVLEFCRRQIARLLGLGAAGSRKLWRMMRMGTGVFAIQDDLAELPDGDEAEAAPPVPLAATPPAPRKASIVRKNATSARQSRLAFEAADETLTPPIDLLAAPEPAKAGRDISPEALHRNAAMLEGVLGDFGISGQITKVSPGPVVTLYELEPAPGIRAARVIALADDIARSMSAQSVRVAVVPGRNVIGIELPNQRRETVLMRELLESSAYQDTQQSLPLTLGKDIARAPVIADLARMPHLLVAGTTGSGKSVAINTMILSLLYRMPPQRCRFIMIDPKMLELSVYEGIPHLLAPVVTEPKKAIVALKWVVREMEERYRAMSKLGVRNIEGYNIRLKQARDRNENLTRQVQTGFDHDSGKPVFEEQPLDLTDLPYIVVIVDEMADLMLVAGKEIEMAVQRLAQMARAAGIHIIMATQRPSVDVITGTIKANFPTRISFQVTSKIDSRTILGEQGGEQLLGQGDMLYMAGGGRITRVHGPFVRDSEVEGIVNFLREQSTPDYLDEVTEDIEGDSLSGETGLGGGAGGNEIYDLAVDLVQREGKASTSFLQRHLKLGYNRAATLIDQLERDGVISPANHVGKREVFNRKAGGY